MRSAGIHRANREVNKMSGTADVRSEHMGVGRMLGVMDATEGRARTGEPLDAGDLA